MTDELMSELDKIRIKEFVKDVAKEDQVFGLSKHDENHFILISDDSEEKPQIMPVWSLKIEHPKFVMKILRNVN